MRLDRVFVANRGEIALRIIRACHEKGLEAVLGASQPDLESLPARTADRTVCIGPGKPADSYLNKAAIMAAAVKSGCDALHPGYGFLAEQPELAAMCDEAGLAFVGPTADTIRAMGDKISALGHARACEIPTLGGGEAVTTSVRAEEMASQLGLPVIVKAAAGGGGRGIRIVWTIPELGEALTTAAREAQSAFGNPTLYIERYITKARHIEVQLLGDSDGNVVHLGDRDCSVQRRHQKVVEEAPAYGLDAALREGMSAAALALGRHLSYRSAGTVEFVVEPSAQRFYFLEMNTRIQVEHPVTEAVTGIDVVKAQLAIAGGEQLPFSQRDVTFTGHAIECRVTAESPTTFLPSPGRITCWEAPSAKGIRIDSHCYSGYVVPPFYDSLLAKIISSANTREEAISLMQGALHRLRIEGIETTTTFLRQLVQDARYLVGDIHTRWLEEEFVASERAVGSGRG